MTAPDTARDIGNVLLRARAYLAKGHWCKGSLKSGEKRCALGALDVALDDFTYLTSDAELALEQQLDIRWSGNNKVPVAAFNDDPDTTLTDVLALFDKALAELGRFHDIPVTPAQVVIP